MEPIFMTPALQDRIWGGQALHTRFGLNLPSEHVGEAWVISAHPNGESTIERPKAYAGMTLSQLYAEHKELFGPQASDTFPLLVKILDARDALSVQVHPDDEYGLANEGELGKAECWYFIDADPGATVVYGHTAKTREEFLEKVEAGDWKDLLIDVPVKAGDFLNVPAGQIHAVGKGTLILETQQNSDTTYRVYDYDRKDADGNLRELHIDKSADVTDFPTKENHFEKKVTRDGKSTITQYLEDVYFSVYGWDIQDETTIALQKSYYLATVIEGSGEIKVNNQAYPLSIADSFILPYGIDEVTVNGSMKLIVSNPENE